MTDDVQAERRAFAEALALIDPARLVFVDESGVVQGMRANYGYAPVGEPCVEAAPYHKGRRTSLIGWIAPTCGGVTALEGPVTRAAFEHFVEHHLAPSLEVGDVVIWDNHTIHKSAIARAAVEARGAVLLKQPRYSPDLNAIEMFWSKLKHLVRQARADTAEALEAALRAACAAVGVKDLAGWIGHIYHITADA